MPVIMRHYIEELLEIQLDGRLAYTSVVTIAGVTYAAFLYPAYEPGERLRGIPIDRSKFVDIPWQEAADSGEDLCLTRYSAPLSLKNAVELPGELRDIFDRPPEEISGQSTQQGKGT